MYLTGFADEAARDLAGQIAATKELGWSNIESRCIDGVNIHDLSDEAFDRAAAALDEAGVYVNCFCSSIANWGKSIESDADCEKYLEQTRRARDPRQRVRRGPLPVLRRGIPSGARPDGTRRSGRSA